MLWSRDRVSMHEESNKMSMNNLATVFGPNMLRPSSAGSGNPMDLAQGTLNIMSQVSIFLYLLKLDSDATRLPKDRPGLLRRLDPNKTPDSFQSPDLSANQDRLIWLASLTPRDSLTSRRCVQWRPDLQKLELYQDEPHSKTRYCSWFISSSMEIRTFLSPCGVLLLIYQ